MDISNITAIPSIVIIVYLVAHGIKAVAKGEQIKRLLPVICGTLGLALGVICYLTLPEFIGAENWITAAAIGIVSGFSATGVNQIFKQISKKNTEAVVDDGGNTE